MPPDPQPLSDDEATYELDRAAWNLPRPRAAGRPANGWAGERAQDEGALDRARPSQVDEAT